MKKGIMSKRKIAFQKLKNVTENFIGTVEEIAKDTELHDKEFLEDTLKSIKEFREACEAKLAKS